MEETGTSQKSLLGSRRTNPCGSASCDTVNAKFAFVKPEVLDASVVYTSLRDLSYLVFPYLKAFFFKQ